MAALETVAALRALAGPEVEISLVARGERFERRAMSTATPFGGDAPPSVPLAELARRAPFALRPGELARVAPDLRVVGLSDGAELPYDVLVVAVGAVAQRAFPGALTFGGKQDAAAVTDALRNPGQLAFVAPAASGWTLPVYELALMAALQRPQASIAVVTAEASPLWIFGSEAGEAVRELFRQRGIALLTGVRVLAAADGMLELDGAEPVPADCAIALPHLAGPAVAGLPRDEHGFIPVDAHGAVAGAAGVYAAGDGTSFPLKQGGLAAQQADAVAEAIAAGLGARVTPRPFTPVVRGLLLTGGAPLYLRSDGARGTTHRLAHAAVSADELWWPPLKVAGRHLAGLLGPEGAELHDLGASPPHGEDAAELALMLAREDADRGDYEPALRALDSAQELAGGRLSPEWERTRTLWQARAGSAW